MIGNAIIFQPEDWDKFKRELSGFVAIEMDKAKRIERPLTKDAAAEYLSISVRTFDQRIADGKIPTKLIHRNGGTPYFFASELEAFLKKS